MRGVGWTGLLDQIAKAGGWIAAADGTIDTSTRTAKMATTMHFAMAENELERYHETSAVVHARAIVDKGRHMGGTPFGYRRDAGKRLVIRVLEAKWVKCCQMRSITSLPTSSATSYAPSSAASWSRLARGHSPTAFTSYAGRPRRAAPARRPQRRPPLDSTSSRRTGALTRYLGGCDETRAWRSELGRRVTDMLNDGPLRLYPRSPTGTGEILAAGALFCELSSRVASSAERMR